MEFASYLYSDKKLTRNSERRSKQCKQFSEFSFSLVAFSMSVSQLSEFWKCSEFKECFSAFIIVLSKCNSKVLRLFISYGIFHMFKIENLLITFVRQPKCVETVTSHAYSPFMVYLDDTFPLRIQYVFPSLGSSRA